MTLDRLEVAQMVDHTLLVPEATEEEVRALVREAKEINTYSICISPSLLPSKDAKEFYDCGSTKLAVVCGFPSGAHNPAAKALEAQLAMQAGVDEIDMVINLGAVKAADYDAVEADILAVRKAAAKVIIKVIIESAALSDDEIVACCKISENAGADFVKTSTGFHKAGGASLHAIELMAQTVGGRLGVKASGGIRDGKFAAEIIAAGATRLGLSGTAGVLETLPK